MCTRGIVAVVEGSTWRGFYNHFDSYPDGLGVNLLSALSKHGREEAARRIREARLVSGSTERATPEKFANTGDLEWFYLLDAQAGLLRVFVNGLKPSASAPKGFVHARWQEVAEFTVDAGGRTSPEEMKVVVPPPWPELPVLAGWPDDDASATQRLDVRRRVARDAIAAGLTFEGVCELFEQAVSEALFHAPWKRPTAPELFVRMPWSVLSSYLSVHLAGLTLRYPSDEWSRTTGATLHLFSMPENEVEVSLARADMLGCVDQARTLESISISALPSERWFFALLDLLRSRRVADPRGEELERLAKHAQLADDWRVFVHRDGRVWSVRKSSGGFQLRLGAPDDDPVFKERPGDPDALIAEQLADGFVER